MSARLKAVAAVAALLVLGLLALWGGTGTDTAAPPAAPGASTSAPAGAGGRSTTADGGTDPESGLPLVALASLPREAQQTVRLIERGGPFPYDRDGVTFGNRERLLPARPGGYYREYTVRTPGEDDRGARRIVTGDDDRELFWTDDHYASFARVQR
ncbi:ribonuclease domain-containing protein [Microlunatus capsulatus]|uniref:Ribonuclease T1 n=1 Tax=Microlunatus capsulatus TaxID=99117 RepID=A0ABS4ZBD2_9ACTN|nr:ribonuclease domain-containing protein [Microlunatus capsulatus]MBP2418373.1 ribonuclease T1 [Microlunatus capsulatus]